MGESKKPFAPTSVSEGFARQQRVKSTCALCGQSVEALLPEAVAWFAEHREAAHPHLPKPRERGRGQHSNKTRPHS
jgi:hypothetical protein